MTTSNNPDISVLICNYNKEEFIFDTLTSVLAQTLKPSQVVVVDDGSTDNSVKLISDFASKHHSIEAVFLKNNVGLAKARNIGLKQIKGEFIAFIDSDDLWVETKLEKQITLLNLKKCDLVYNEYCTFAEDRKIRQDHPKPFLRGANITGKLIEGNYIMGSSSAVLCKFDKVIEAGGFDGYLQDIASSFAEDWDMWLRLSKTCRFDFVNEPLTLLYSGGGYYEAPEDDKTVANRFKAHFWVRQKHWPDQSLRHTIIEKTVEEWAHTKKYCGKARIEELLKWMTKINPDIKDEILRC